MCVRTGACAGELRGRHVKSSYVGHRERVLGAGSETAHRVILPKSVASERCDQFLVTHVKFLMPTTTVGIVGIHTMLRARF